MLQNSYSIIKSLNETNKKNVQSLLQLTNFLLFTQNKLKNKVSSVIDLVLKRGSKNYNKLSTHDTAHWGKKTNGV